METWIGCVGSSRDSDRILPDPESVVRALRIKIKMRELERLISEESKVRFGYGILFMTRGLQGVFSL